MWAFSRNVLPVVELIDPKVGGSGTASKGDFPVPDEERNVSFFRVVNSVVAWSLISGRKLLRVVVLENVETEAIMTTSPRILLVFLFFFLVMGYVGISLL